MAFIDPNDEEVQKLLEILESTPAVISSPLEDLHLTHKFILHHDIKNGDGFIPTILVYDLYRKWCKELKLKAFTRAMFFRSFKKYFRQRKDKDTRYYLLDPKPFNLSSDEYLRIKQEYNEKLKVYRKLEKEEE